MINKDRYSTSWYIPLQCATLLVKLCKAHKSSALELYALTQHMVAWSSGNIVGRINEVTLRQAQLILGWVTVFSGQTTSVFHQATQANLASYPEWDGK